MDVDRVVEYVSGVERTVDLAEGLMSPVTQDGVPVTFDGDPVYEHRQVVHDRIVTLT